MNLISYGWPFLSSGGGNFVTSTTVLNMPPTNIFLKAELTGVMILDGGGSGAVGFTGYTTVDPATQLPTQVDLTPGQFFMCTGMFGANNVDSVTLFIDASDGGTATFIQGSFQIYSMP